MGSEGYAAQQAIAAGRAVDKIAQKAGISHGSGARKP